MKRRGRYDLPVLPKQPKAQQQPRASLGSSRYITHLFIIVIFLGVGLLVATRLLSPTQPAQPEGFAGGGAGGGGGSSIFTLPIQPVQPESVSAAGVAAVSATAMPEIIGSVGGPNPDVIRRDYVPNGAPGSAAVVAEINRKRELQLYTVIEGDTVFGIALKFGLAPETVLWSNFKTLKDNPDLLSIGQQLIIPPQDGLIIEVEQGDTIDGLARRFGVPADVIAKEPINTLSDINAPLGLGQIIYVPGGQRETVVWQVPKPVATGKVVRGAKVYRVGVCGEVAIPQLGSGAFNWPANRRYLSGYNFSAWHAGLDIAGRLGEPIYAIDGGTVTYAGYSLNAAGVPVGYGQYVVLDHGNGYVSLYAHASQLYVKCGQQVRRGAVIAAVGSVGKSTGPHLHFEIRLNGGAVNPWTVLPQ
jgi:murein DD-endopeptidase MepM/ murein hydrolase activator NlpD